MELDLQCVKEAKIGDISEQKDNGQENMTGVIAEVLRITISKRILRARNVVFLLATQIFSHLSIYVIWNS